MRCGVYSLRENYTQTIHEAYIERLRVNGQRSTVNGQRSMVNSQRDKKTKRLREEEWERGREEG